MIQYKISLQDLEQKIEAEKEGWLVRAGDRITDFKDLGYYSESSSIWSEVKVVFIRIQHGKCAYCERQLESEAYGKIEHDLEHFRPKKNAKPWKLSQELKQAGVVLTPPLSGSSDHGYHLLAYNPLNYCTSCKTCNSILKSDYFPISGVRVPEGDDPKQLRSEKPLLINPVGNFDADPASLISFHGLSPMATFRSGYKSHRGLVSIEFFRLDDRSRKYLFRERADLIVGLHSFLKLAEQSGSVSEQNVYRGLVDVKTKESSPHANCARCYEKLFHRDRMEADKIFKLARQYLQTISA